MDIATLKAHIKTKNLQPFYIFTGPERKIADIYIEEMAKTVDGSVKKFGSITPGARFLRTPAVVKSRHICVFYDDKEILSNEDAQAFLSQAGERTGYVVVLLLSAVDKRTKLYKKFEDRIVTFDYLPVPVLMKYVHKDLKLTDASAERLITICEQDYGRLLLEMDKISCYAEAAEVSDEEAFQNLVADGTIYVPPTDAVFRFVDAVMARKTKLAFKLLDESLASGEAILVLLANLYTAIKQVLQVQTLPAGTKDASGATGLTPYQVQCAKAKSGVYSNADLIYFLKVVRSAEKRIKTGEMEESVAVPYTLVNLW